MASIERSMISFLSFAFIVFEWQTTRDRIEMFGQIYMNAHIKP